MGYNAAKFNSDGQVLRGASFITIGVKDAQDNPCVRLSDLKVTGYEGEIGAGVKIAPLEKNGSNVWYEDICEVFYFWKDAPSSGYPAGWYGIDDQPMKDNLSVLPNAEDITFAVGQGICFVVDYGRENLSLQSAGEVIQAQSSFTFPNDGQILVSNPLCRPVALSEISISGYTGEFGAGAKIAPIEKNGANKWYEDICEIFYYWKDAPGSGYPAGWWGIDDQPMKDGASVLDDADKIFYQPGEAMCFVVDDNRIGCQVDFPSLGLTTAE